MKKYRSFTPVILLSALALTATPTRSSAQVPTVETLPATEMLNDVATLNGTVNPNGSETQAWFEWGTIHGNSFANQTEPQNVGNGATVQPMTTSRSNLVQGIAYHYRQAASNHFGMVRGEEQRFWIPRIDLHTPAFLTVEPGTFIDRTTANDPLPEIVSGSYHNLGLMADGTVVAWGLNNSEQCNVPAAATNVVAVAADGSRSLAVRTDGTIFSWGNDGSYGLDTIPPDATNVTALAAGASHNLALRAEGTVVAWGNNNAGQTNVPSNATNVAAIAAGFTHSLVLRADGSVVAWGENETNGQCTVSADATNGVAIAAKDYLSWAMRSDGTVVSWGHDRYEYLGTLPSAATDVTAIAAGNFHALALRADGTIVGWGFDAEGQASIPSDATNVATVAVGDYHSLAIRTDGSVIAWGRNSSGQCNIPAAISAGLPLSVEGMVETNTLGTYVLDYSCTNSLGAVATATRTVVVATPPAIATLPATDVGADQATLQGTVNPGASETRAWFEWGTSTSYGNSTAMTDLGNGTNTVPISSVLTGLVENLAYHYRMAGSNQLGIVYGDDETFGIWQLDDINLADSGAGSLREVIAGAPAGSAIVITNSGTLVLTSGELSINKDLTITGPGATNLTISGNNNSRVFNMAEGCTVVLSGLTIRDGRSANGAYAGGYGYPGGPGSPGGGIYNAGNLTLNECSVINNHAGAGSSGAIGHSGDPGQSGGYGGAGGSGGGIYNHSPGTLILNRCTLSSNSSGAGGHGGTGGRGATGGFFEYGDDGGPGGVGGNGGLGGGIYNAGMLEIDHCSVSGNWNGTGGNGGRGGNGWSDGNWGWDDGKGGRGGNGGWGGNGGGIHNVGNLSLSNCTFACNSTSQGGSAGAAGWGGDGNYGPGTPGTDGSGGGIRNSATTKCLNTIVASNTDPSGPDDADGTFTSLGYNLIGTTNGASGFASLSNDLLNVEAHLEPLADNGGPTLTHWLQPTSPAIHAGATNMNVLATDQRGFPRVFNGRADIGAVELQVWWPIVTTLPATNSVMHGAVNPKGSQTFSWFEYGLATAYGGGTEMTHIAGDPEAIHGVQSAPSNLLPWMTYHYRAVASNRIGRVHGADLTFTLPGPTVTPPSLSTLDDLLLPQGGSTSVWFIAEPAGVEVRVTCNNLILLPESGLALGGSSLGIAPDPNHSGSAQITVTASDGMQSASQTFTLTVVPVDPSQLLGMASQSISNGFWHLQVYDAGTASTNYMVEHRPDLSPTSTWTTATDFFDLGGGEYALDIGPAQGDSGFYRIKGFRLLLGGFASSQFETEEGRNAAGVVVEFNSIFTGTLGYTWTDETGTTHAGTAEVNGTTVVIPLPAEFIADDTGIGQLVHLTLELDAGMGYVQGDNVESLITIGENDANWEGAIETDIGMLGFTLSMLKVSGTLNGWIQNDEFGFFPTNVLVQLALAENTFTAVATDIPLPVFAGTASGVTNHLDLRLDAANHPGETNIGPDRIEGEATLVIKVSGQPYLDAAQTGPFILTRPPTAASTNETPLQPVP